MTIETIMHGNWYVDLDTGKPFQVNEPGSHYCSDNKGHLALTDRLKRMKLDDDILRKNTFHDIKFDDFGFHFNVEFNKEQGIDLYNPYYVITIWRIGEDRSYGIKQVSQLPVRTVDHLQIILRSVGLIDLANSLKV